ncbi:alpha-L-fucosidase [Paenibacillus sp. MMS20-IR301]|uniref:alpha-L-fucosidase n=1 Tax=Paenibacillus sp. MMS20-IR301 TaxID=2895946 RepID=UPI0028EB4E6A|nr:alpha-L-fucosidase [Paenibacillus sp. MMS20-IR301]WNS43147.1 alpha-L-fucosidase [Paenibacillus sp. MMS20-IR301]
MKLEEICNVRPSERQLKWQRLEFYGFIHFGMNTMTGAEWGLGHEDRSLFNPGQLDASEWVSVLKASGMRAVILTCKHHDGFCLWPSRYSEHTVAHTPWRGGKGDLVREVADACRQQGLVFGTYLSPWDRTEQTYGEGKAYDDFYIQQLTELLTEYGGIGCVWLDGANGEGPGGKKQYYDWDRYYEVIRRLQPQCVISVCGPDIRWVGNEAGQTRAEEWSVVPKLLQDAEKVAEKSQQADDGRFSRSLNSMDEDLGSRAAIAAYEGEWVWYPAEVNTSIRPGWFYHEEEDTQVRSGSELFDIYLNAVGGNATFLLNIPPTKEGLIAEPDRRALAELGRRIAGLSDHSLMRGAEVRASSSAGDRERVQQLIDGEVQPDQPLWQPAEGDSEPWLEVVFPQKVAFNTVILQEQITLGQRVEAFELWTADQQQWSKLAEGSIIGYRRIIRVPDTTAGRLKIVFKQFRGFPALSHVRVLSIEE